MDINSFPRTFCHVPVQGLKLNAFFVGNPLMFRWKPTDIKILFWNYFCPAVDF